MIYLLRKFFMNLFHRHTWSKWKTFDEGTIKRREPYLPITGEYVVIGRYIYQSKECTTCGKVNIRYQSIGE